jgi:hypothetical protein
MIQPLFVTIELRRADGTLVLTRSGDAGASVVWSSPWEPIIITEMHAHNVALQGFEYRPSLRTLPVLDAGTGD